MNIKIKEIQVESINKATKLIKNVFMEFEAPDYKREGIDFFLSYISIESLKSKIEKGDISMWGAFLDNTIIGVVAMRPPCAISLLFVDKKHHRKGVARKLLTYALKEYNKKGLKVTVNSSPYAVEAYEKMGFKKINEEEENLGIRFQPMESEDNTN